MEEIKTASLSLNEKTSTDVEVKYTFPERFSNNYYIDFTENAINGIKISMNDKNVNLSLHWNFLLNNLKVIDYKYPHVSQNIQTTYHSQGKVFYKFISWNTMLLLSTNDKNTLIVSVINTKNGKMLHQSFINNVDTSRQIKSLYEENLIIISYFKKHKSIVRNEIYVIEVIKREIEHSFINMLEKIFKINITGDLIENKNHDEIQDSDLIFLSQTYVLPRNIKGLFVSKTHINIANKYIIFLFENNQIFFIDRRGISPRRPIMKEDKSKGTAPVIDPTLNSPYIDPEITPYNPMLTLDHKYVLNIDFMSDQIDDIIITPTENESIFLICTIGLNVSCYKSYPDKTFDILDMKFSYSVILIFMFGIMVYIINIVTCLCS
jgi:hypothetical protein